MINRPHIAGLQNIHFEKERERMMQLIWLFFFEDILSFKGKIDYLDYYFGRFLLEIIIEIMAVIFIVGKFT